jgi:hypothetical protein
MTPSKSDLELILEKLTALEEYVIALSEQQSAMLNQQAEIHKSIVKLVPPDTEQPASLDPASMMETTGCGHQAFSTNE